MKAKELRPREPKNLERGTAKCIQVETDELTMEAVEPFDLAWDGTTTFTPWRPPILPKFFTLGVIVGSSGSGKSTMLKEIGKPSDPPAWEEDRSIASHFLSGQEAIDRLTAVGLGSVPTWCKPYSVLSTGERFRADLARCIESNMLIDEFSSVVDRHVAMASSRGFGRLLRTRRLQGVVLATCHRDVLPWLEPDWIIDTDAGLFIPRPKEWVQPCSLVVEVHRARRDAWHHFADHHYLASTLHPFARCYLATWDDQIVGFASAIPFPHGTIKQAWRETRTVVLPEFQGLGLGVQISDLVAAIHKAEGYRYFSRTQHPRMGAHRETSDLWKPTSSNRKKATAPQRDERFQHWQFDEKRVAFSHEYVGPPNPIRDPMMPDAAQRMKPYNRNKA